MIKSTAAYIRVMPGDSQLREVHHQNKGLKIEKKNVSKNLQHCLFFLSECLFLFRLKLIMSYLTSIFD